MKKDMNTKIINGRPVTKVSEYGQIFLSNTIEISGIAGIKPGDIWTTNYLPEKFRDRAHFWTKNVEQTVSSDGWRTKLTGQMVWSIPKDSPVVTKETSTKKRTPNTTEQHIDVATFTVPKETG